MLVAMLAGMGLMAVFQLSQPDQTIDRREPVVRTLDAAALKDAMAFMEGSLAQGSGKAAAKSGLWPHFRGQKRDGIVKDAGGLARAWPESGPPVLWHRKIEKGHAGVVVQNGKVYLHDYDSEKRMDVVRCMSFENGEDIWTYSYPVKIKTSHGITRCVPAITPEYLVTFGPKCHISCFHPDTGERYWAKSLVLDYQSKVPTWYAGQCPIIENDLVILAPSGPETMMVALDIKTGDEVWSTPNPEKWDMTHCSIGTLMVDGKKQYVYSGSGGVAGVDPATGTLLWINTDWKIKIAAIATPLDVGDGRVFLSAGYGVGSMMIQVQKQGDTYEAKELFRLTDKEFGSAQHSPIFYKGAIFGVRPSEEAVCLNLDGSLRWTSTMANKYGIGPYMIAEDIFFVMDNHGKLSMLEASPDAFKLLDEAVVLDDSHDSWGPMALVDGKMIVRDLDQMACLDLRKNAN